MASFSAELRVAGRCYSLLRCDYGTHQATDARGRVITKVRYSRIRLLLDVPRESFLAAWAADEHKRCAADIVYYNADGGQASETLHLAGAYCVYHEQVFHAGDTGTGSYVLHLELSDPDGWSWQPGGPGAYVPPTPREHGKLPTLPLANNLSAAEWPNQKNLPAWSAEHKAARWAEYQRDHAQDPKAYNQARWDKSYETTRNNNVFGLGREREYAAAMGAESRVLKTAFTFRQIDMFIEKTGYCGQLKTGMLYLRDQEKIDLQKDADLVAKEFEVEYILEKGASKPMLTAIKAAGATYKIGPQIP